MAAASPAVQKALTKLGVSLDAGQPYEGHEMFKTAFHRMRARRQLADSYALAQGGAALQFERGQLNCGVELCMLLVEACTTDEAEPCEVSRLEELLLMFPTEAEREGDEPPIESAVKVVGAGMRWLRRVKGIQEMQRLHLELAQYITRCLGWAGLGAALPHYAKCADVSPCAAAVAAAVQAAPAEEADLIIARAALALASDSVEGLGKAPADSIARASSLLLHFQEAMRVPRQDTPLLHFVDLFLEALSRRSEALVQLVLHKYRPSLDRDPSMRQLVDKCRVLHMAPAAGVNGGGLSSNLLGDMFQQLLGAP